MTYKRINLSYDTVVLCVVGISQDFKIFTQILAIGLKSILFITLPSSFAHELPSTIRDFSTLFHFLSVMLPTSFKYSQSTSEGKL